MRKICHPGMRLMLLGCLTVAARPVSAGAPADAPSTGRQRPVASQPAAGARKLLAWSDFQYLGAFRAPRVRPEDVGSRYGYSRPVMCWNPNGDPGGEDDGFPGSIMIAGHPSKELIGEISIPVPKVLTDKDKQADGTYDTRRLPAAGQLGKFFDPSSGKKNVFEKRAELWSGLWWDGDVLHMSWSLWYHVDSEVKNYLHHMAARRRADGSWETVIKPYTFKIDPHRIAGYISTAPRWWAKKHLGGRRFLTGFNVAQGTGASNCGPSLYAYDPEAPEKALVLMEFPHGGKGSKTRDDDWKPCDAWRGLAFIDTGTKYAVVYCGRKGLGEVRYGIGRPTDASRSKGYHSDPYRPEVRLYDPAVFLRVLDKRTKPHQPRAYEKVNLTSTFFQPDKAFLTAGIGYDPANRLVYIVQISGDRDSGRYEAQPVVHVWRIRQRTGADDADAAPADMGRVPRAALSTGGRERAEQ